MGTFSYQTLFDRNHLRSVIDRILYPFGGDIKSKENIVCLYVDKLSSVCAKQKSLRQSNV